MNTPLAGFSGVEGFALTKDVINHPSIEIGDYTYGSPQVLIGPYAKLRIGKFCSIAHNVSISLTSGHQPQWVSTYPFAILNNWYPKARHLKEDIRQVKGHVIIGNDVWIGQNTFILPGVTIGDGAIIGAYSVVTKNVPPYHVAAGNPCKVRKKRFSEEEIKALLKLQWWNWPIEKIQDCADILSSGSVDLLLKMGDQK